MTGPLQHLSALSCLHELHDAASGGSSAAPLASTFRAVFRSGMAALAKGQLEADEAPLEGLRPEQLLESVRVALVAGLFDDLDFLSETSAACALYAVACALPLGPERRELGRRVLGRLQAAHAGTFVALARHVALGSARVFDGPFVRARLALVHALPLGGSIAPDPLSLVLVARRELVERFIVAQVSGPLWDRVLAASILERAAREAVRRGALHDPGLCAAFETDAVRNALERLVVDREPLVWRRAASARGLFATVSKPIAEDVERDLASEGSVSRVRRGALSLAASLPSRPSHVLARADLMLSGPLFVRDPGLVTAFVYGSAVVAELEPEATEKLLALCVAKGGKHAAEALASLLRDGAQPRPSDTVRELSRVLLRKADGKLSDDEGHNAHVDLVCEALGELGPDASSALWQLRDQAIEAYASGGARAGYAKLCDTLDLAQQRMDELEQCVTRTGVAARRLEYRHVQDLDGVLLASSTLSDLCYLGEDGLEVIKTRTQLSTLLTRFAGILVAQEAAPHAGGEHVPHLTLRMGRLRALLHALDTDIRHGDEKVHELREQRIEKAALLLRRVHRDESSAMDRIVHASLARALESLVRDEALEPSDVLYAVAAYVPTPQGVLALADASMLADVRGPLRAHARLTRLLTTDGARVADVLAAFDAIITSLPAEGAPRTERARQCLRRVSRSLHHVANASSLAHVARVDATLATLADAIDELSRLAVGVERRLGALRVEVSPTAGHGIRTLAAAASRAVETDSRVGLEVTLEALTFALREEVPWGFAEVVTRVLSALLSLPREAPNAPLFRAHPEDDDPLPSWVPASRTLGAYFVRRALGAEVGIARFEVVPVAARSDAAALPSVLEVPAYDGVVSRELSEGEFIRAFRQEASLLLAVPSCRNLARVLLVDGAALPRPLLVSEWIPGPSLASLLLRGTLTSAGALRLLSGVLSGLCALHRVGVGHLGLRPSNVVLSGSETDPQAVVVGFGLSGRHVRLGCASTPYGAPELWQPRTDAEALLPAAADIYAFGCMAYEALVGEPLFDATSDAGCIAHHLSHDGAPHGITNLLQTPATRPFAEWLVTCLRRDPRARASADELLSTLPSLKPLSRAPWPIATVTPEESEPPAG